MTFGQRLRRIPVLIWIVVPVALAALIAWPLGGWNTATLVSRTLPEYASNQVFHTHRFDIRVDDAWLTEDQHPAGYNAPEPLDDNDPAEIYLVVRAEFTNVTSEGTGSSELGGYLIPEIDGVVIDEYTQADYVLVSDRTTSPELNPGLTRDLFIVFTIPKGSVDEGDDLRIGLYDATPIKALLFYGTRWEFHETGYAVRNVDAR